jgi:hypothetical protein
VPCGGSCIFDGYRYRLWPAVASWFRSPLPLRAGPPGGDLRRKTVFPAITEVAEISTEEVSKAAVPLKEDRSLHTGKPERPLDEKATSPVSPGSPSPAFAAGEIDEVLRETHWGESSGELFRQFGTNAIRLPRALDFGDSYADVVLRGQTLGAVPMVVFFQMDKVTHGLKRIQLERPRHGVNPPAFRAIAAALHDEFGKPDQTCIIPVLPDAGYQAAAEESWVRDGAAVSAIFRDTTLQAFEGYLFGPATGWCGLRGQLLVRIGPPDGGADPCALARHYGLPIAPAPSGTPR